MIFYVINIKKRLYYYFQIKINMLKYKFMKKNFKLYEHKRIWT